MRYRLKQVALYCVMGLACCLSNVVFMDSLMHSTAERLPIPPRADSPRRGVTQSQNIRTQRPASAECDTCCYNYTPSSHIKADFRLLSPAKLTERHCEKRLPQAIIIGERIYSLRPLSHRAIYRQPVPGNLTKDDARIIMNFCNLLQIIHF